MSKVQLNTFATDAALAQTVAERWLKIVAQTSANHESHVVALSGGRITKAFFSEVVRLSQKNRTSLENVHFFWADERCVSPTDPESNFFLADQLLFRPLQIHPRQIHRLRGEAEPRVAVESAAFELNSIARKTPSGMPQIDIVFLGMGEDGHVASLFPNASREVIECPAPFLHINDSPKPPPQRVSLSYAAIVAAAEVWVLASGAGKEKAWEDSLAGKTPLGRLLEARNRTTVFTDLVRK